MDVHNMTAEEKVQQTKFEIELELIDKLQFNVKFDLPEASDLIMDEPPVSILVQGANEWRTAEDWPLPETRWIPFNLHPNGLLCEIEPQPNGGTDSFEDSPYKRGSLMYYTPPLVENTEVIGHIVLNLYASCTASEALFFVSLWDVDPKGKESLLTRGWLRGSHREVDQKRSKAWQPFHPHTKSQPLTPGEIYEYQDLHQ